MKKSVRFICAVLVLLMALSVCVGCKDDKGPEQNTTAPDAKAQEIAGISQKNYKKDFVIINPDAGLYQDYYWSEDMSESSNIAVANYNREVAIEEHLGIEIYHEVFEQSNAGIYNRLEAAHLAGNDDQQLVLTHTFQALVSLMSAGILTDLSEIPSISMNEEYYNNNIMESVKYQGHKFLGSSALILHRPTFILFNKSMAEDLSAVGGADKLYQHVRDKTWTLDQMFTYAKLVDISLNETKTDPMEGTYGFISMLDWQLCSFPTASGYFHASIDNDGNYQLKNFNDDIFDMFRTIVTFTDTNYFYGWTWSKPEREISMETGRVFFATADVETMIKQMLSSEVSLGVLPYPTMKEGMVAQNLDWAGYFCIPSVVKDKQMSGEVTELLSYYGETEIKHEFYDVLLGLRASKVPQDQEMLELIFDNLAIEPALAFLNKGDADLADIFYVIPRMIAQKDKAMASWYEKNYGPAKIQLDSVNQ